MASRKLQNLIEKAQAAVIDYQNLPVHTPELEEVYLGIFENLTKKLGSHYGLGNKRNVIKKDNDSTAFYKLPPKLIIYRGFREPEKRNGISWTLDRFIAERFAYKATVAYIDLFITRIDGRDFYAKGYTQDDINKLAPVVLTATCALKDVLVYANNINEQEIIINPKNLTILAEDSIIREEVKIEVDAGKAPMAATIEVLLETMKNIQS